MYVRWDGVIHFSGVKLSQERRCELIFCVSIDLNTHNVVIYSDVGNVICSMQYEDFVRRIIYSYILPEDMYVGQHVWDDTLCAFHDLFIYAQNPHYENGYLVFHLTKLLKNIPYYQYIEQPGNKLYMDPVRGEFYIDYPDSESDLMCLKSWMRAADERETQKGINVYNDLFLYTSVYVYSDLYVIFHGVTLLTKFPGKYEGSMKNISVQINISAQTIQLIDRSSLSLKIYDTDGLPKSEIVPLNLFKNDIIHDYV
jgi:hypothetical protein